MAKWQVVNEEDNPVFNTLGLILYYVNMIDKTEYPDFETWQSDMIKCDLIRRV